MKKIKLTIVSLGILSLAACSNQNTGINNEAENPAAQNDSSTTNPVNSEYGTPNASENKVEAAQSEEAPKDQQ
jgi:uncharacterized lipoprotein YajG